MHANYLAQKLSPNFSAVIVTAVVLQTRGGRLLSIEIPSNVTFAQRKGWADNTLWADNMYFTVINYSTHFQLPPFINLIIFFMH